VIVPEKNEKSGIVDEKYRIITRPTPPRLEEREKRTVTVEPSASVNLSPPLAPLTVNRIHLTLDFKQS